MIYHLEGNLASSVSHRKSSLCGHLFAAACVPYMAVGMDLRCGGDVLCIRLCHWYVAAERETSACSGGLATVICQFFTPLGLGLAPTANSPGSGFQTSPFFTRATSMWTSTKPWVVGSPSFDEFNRPSWLQQLGTTPMSTSGYGRDRRHCGAQWSSSSPTWILLALLFMLTHFHLFAFGTLEPLAQASKFSILLRSNHRWLSYFSYLRSDRITDGRPTPISLCYDLPHCTWTACCYTLPARLYAASLHYRLPPHL